MAEDLNIENRIRRNVLLALNKHKKDMAAAAEELGVNPSTLVRFKKRFDIVRCPVTREYSISEAKKKKVFKV